MVEANLDKISGRSIKSLCEELRNEDQGCASIWIATSGEQDFYVVIGWHNYQPKRTDIKPDKDPNWTIAWKIGIQSINCHMRTDFDIDFQVPKNDESGEVDDTTEVLISHLEKKDGVDTWSVPAGYASWDAVAEKMKREARRILKLWA